MKLADVLFMPLSPLLLFLNQFADLYVARHIRETKRLIMKLGIGGVSLALMLFVMRTK
jgi:hypothetical protein